MKIFLGADHRGFALKEKVKEWLIEWKVEFEDLGNTIYDEVDDFPDFAIKVAEKVSQGKGEGIVFCGSGGMALTANKFKGVRAVETWNVETVQHAKEHDAANVLMIATDFVREDDAKAMVKTWLNTSVKVEEKYQRRLNKIKQIEERNFV